jgi:hypothetical protein
MMPSTANNFILRSLILRGREAASTQNRHCVRQRPIGARNRAALQAGGTLYWPATLHARTEHDASPGPRLHHHLRRGPLPDRDAQAPAGGAHWRWGSIEMEAKSKEEAIRLLSGWLQG